MNIYIIELADGQIETGRTWQDEQFLLDVCSACGAKLISFAHI